MNAREEAELIFAYEEVYAPVNFITTLKFVPATVGLTVDFKVVVVTVVE